MKTIERCFLRVADSDWNWIGFNWLRPVKDVRIGIGYIIGSSILLGLPCIGVGAAMLYFVFGRVSFGTWFFLFVAATMVEMLLHIVLAHFWNRRAGGLMRNVAA
jgi:hypothetical protein